MENELYHHGIKGQKWGIRRFQNKNGSLTKAGKKRYDGEEDDSDKGKTGKPAKPSAKSVKDMSTEELTAAIRRLELEQRYSQLNPQKVSTGKKYVQDFIEKSVMPAVTDASKKLLNESLIKAGKKYLGLDENGTKDSLAELRKEVEGLRLKNEKNKLVKGEDDPLKKQAEEAKNRMTIATAEKFIAEWEKKKKELDS